MSAITSMLSAISSMRATSLSHTARRSTSQMSQRSHKMFNRNRRKPATQQEWSFMHSSSGYAPQLVPQPVDFNAASKLCDYCQAECSKLDSHCPNCECPNPLYVELKG